MSQVDEKGVVWSLGKEMLRAEKNFLKEIILLLIILHCKEHCL
jgi:hypothetical protein